MPMFLMKGAAAKRVAIVNEVAQVENQMYTHVCTQHVCAVNTVFSVICLGSKQLRFTILLTASFKVWPP